MDKPAGALAVGASSRAEAAIPAGRELEIKFKTDAAGLKLALHSELLAAEGADAPGRALRSVYYDTSAGDLRKLRIALRVRKVRGAHIIGLKRARPLGEGPFSRDEVEARAPSLEPDIALFGAEIAAELNGVIDGRPLEPQFETRIKRRLRRIQFERSVIEVAFDEGVIVAGDRRRPLTEIELELKAGEDAPLYDLALRLAEALPLRLDMMSKAERGFLLAADARPAPVRAGAFRFSADATLDDAVETIIAATIGQFMANWPAMAETDHPESIHQMRVALRRLRTALALFNRVLPCAEFVTLRAEAKRIASALGPARELDAFRELVETGPLTHHARSESFEALLRAVEERRAAAYVAARALIDDPATTRFALNARAVLARRAWRAGLSGAELPRLTQSVRAFAGEALERLHKRALKRGRRLLQLPPPERHRVRIALKNLRYAAEFFGVLFGGSTARPYIRAVARVQDGLGAYNDAASATHLLQDVVTDAGPQAAMAGGVVLGWYGRGAAIANDNLRKTWKSFKRARHFWR
jgi:inorganic triphosphatase YgiF